MQPMRRRDFCAYLAGAVTATGLPVPALARAASASGFGRYAQDYAQFCATPQMQRVFYALQGGVVQPEKLDGATWKPAGFGDAPALPLPGSSWDGVPMEAPVSDLAGNGPFGPTWDSLSQYECPEWYRDAKFAIWNHWSPQCVPEDGDWYARHMYGGNMWDKSQPQYHYHLEHYGHPSKFGYKDLCAQWTMLNWNPEELMDLYVRAGAKMFIALANHHDGFDTWNSKHHAGTRRTSARIETSSAPGRKRRALAVSDSA